MGQQIPFQGCDRAGAASETRRKSAQKVSYLATTNSRLAGTIEKVRKKPATIAASFHELG